MKIGIDAKWFYSGSPSGVVVVRNIVENILKINLEDEFYIFLDKKEKNKEFPFTHPKLKLIYIWADFNLLSNLFVLPIVANKLKIDIILFQNFNAPFFKGKKIVFIHDAMYYTHPEYFNLKERLYLYPTKLLQLNCNKVITISESEKKRLIKIGFQKDIDIEVVYNGIGAGFKSKEKLDPSKIPTIRNKYKLPHNFLLYVGRLNIRKNIKHLLEAMPHCSEDISLIIVGKVDNKMFDYEKLINNLNIHNRVIKLGFVENEDLPYIYALATIFCYPSYEEGFGIPPLESMSAGVPVVVSNRSCLPEVCGEAGSYADPDSPKSIAIAINKLLLDSKLYDEKKRLGFEQVKKYSWVKSATLISNILHKNS